MFPQIRGRFSDSAATQMRACRSFLPNCTTLKSAKYNVLPKGVQTKQTQAT